MIRWVALAVVSLVAVVAAVLATSGQDDSDSDDKGGMPLTECEQAYEEGLGNAATSDRASWIADCEAEMGD